MCAHARPHTDECACVCECVRDTQTRVRTEAHTHTCISVSLPVFCDRMHARVHASQSKLERTGAPDSVNVRAHTHMRQDLDMSGFSGMPGMLLCFCMEMEEEESCLFGFRV